MDVSKILKSAVPHVVAIIVFLLINVILYSPVFFENKTINQNDILQGAGANQELINFRVETGEEGLWTNSMFSGMPGYLINTYWSGDVLIHAWRVLSIGLPSPASHTFIAMVAFYILLLIYGVNPYLAIAGGLAFGANPYFIILIEAGHIWKVAAISIIPLVLAGIELTFRKKYLWGFVLTALAMALEIRSNHFQITYYLLLVVLLYGLFKLVQAIKEKTFPDLLKTLAILTVAVTLGVGANLGKLWTAYEYGYYSIRGPAELSTSKEVSKGGLDRDYAFSWSNGIAEPFTLLIPYFYGGSSVEYLDMNSTVGKGLIARGVSATQARSFVTSLPTYWGDQPFTSGPAYGGAIMVFLFVLGLFIIKGEFKWWLLSATILGIMLSWGKNFELFNYLMFDYFPGYNKFRAVSTTIIIPLFTMPLLGLVALQKVFNDGWKEHQKSLLYSVGIVAGFCLLMVVASGMLGFKAPVDAQLSENPWLVDLIRDQRASLFRGDAIRSAVFILLVSLIIYFFGKGKIKLTLAAFLVTALVAIDFMGVNKRYLREDNFVRNLEKNYFAETDADRQIKRERDMHYRVLNLNNPFNEAKTSYRHASIGGYHGAKLRRYQDLIDYHLRNEISTAVRSLQSGSTDFSNLSTLNMLNAKYLKFGDKAEQVLPNRTALGNAWMVSSVSRVKTPDEEIARLGTIDVAKEAVVNMVKFSQVAENYGSGKISLTTYQPNYLQYEAVASGNTLAIFSEIYYPKGWKAFIDGEEVPIIQANYVLRALEIPDGKHTVEFKFEPAAYFVGNTAMRVCGSLIILFLVGTIFIDARKKI